MEKDNIFSLEDKEAIVKSLEFIKYFRENGIPFDKYIHTFGKTKQEIEDMLISRFYEPISPRIKRIKEIPIMVTKFDEIVCLPKLHELKSIAIFGKTGSGKTLFSHSLIDWFHNYYHYHIAILNDFKFENYPWVYPNSSKVFIKKLKSMHIQQTPLPLVPIFPNIEQTKEFKKKIPTLKIKIPFQDFLNKIRTFIDLGLSEKYYDLMKDEIRLCENTKQIYGILDKYIENKNVVSKVFTSIISYEKEGLISFDDNILGYIQTNDNKIDTVFPQLIRCDLIPSLVTTDLRNCKHSPNLIKYLIIDLIEHLNNDKDFKDKNIIFYVDELNQILSLDNKTADVKESIKEIARTGRGVGASLLFCAQNRSKIPDDISSECSYLFTFQTNNSSDISKITKDFALSESEGKEIRNLETFECIGHTNESFIVYDVVGNRKYETKSVRGIIIPPLSHHLKPRSTNQIRMERDFTELFACDFVKKYLRLKHIKLINPKNKMELFKANFYCDSFIDYSFDGAYIMEHFNYGKYFYKTSKISEIKETIDYNELKRIGLWIIKRPIKHDKEITRDSQEFIYDLEYGDKIGGSSIIQREMPRDIKFIRYIHNIRGVLLIGRDCNPKIKTI